MSHQEIEWKVHELFCFSLGRSWSFVDRVIVCLLALESLQLSMNLLQYAVTLMSLLSLENLCVMSSGGCSRATCTFLISKFSVGVLNSVVGQLDGSCESHCGPFYHSVDVASVDGSIPLEMRSAGLDWDGTCLHVAEDVSSWMVATLLPTNVFHLMDPVSMSKQWKCLSIGVIFAMAFFFFW